MITSCAVISWDVNKSSAVSMKHCVLAAKEHSLNYPNHDFVLSEASLSAVQNLWPALSQNLQTNCKKHLSSFHVNKLTKCHCELVACFIVVTCIFKVV